MRYINVSLFIIGTEITRGIIADKHGELLAHELTALGYHINRIVIVPDDGSLGEMLRHSLSESDILLLTGGLGPTSDDLTRSLIASIANVPLVKDEYSYQMLYERIGERINGANLQQVYFPAGFTPIENPKGTAPGFKGTFTVSRGAEEAEILCYAMPGPPVEMHEMFFKRILPELSQLAGHDDFERTEFSTFLIPESKLEDACAEVSLPNIQWGTRVQEHRISLYLSGSTLASRRQMAQRIEAVVGQGLIEEGDVEAIEILTRYLQERHLTIATAESCTGGLLGKLLTDAPGSSSWFWGSAVTYANEAKNELLGVDPEIISREGAVSAATARAMAQGILRRANTAVAVGITGIAGPSGGTLEKPVGEIWFGFAAKNLPTVAISLRFSSLNRSYIRRRAAVAATLLTFSYLNGVELLDRVKSWQYI